MRRIDFGLTAVIALAGTGASLAPRPDGPAERTPP
jgi:hypothetical protein